MEANHHTEKEHPMEEEYSDDELTERIKLGDENAAEMLIKRYYAAILRYCKRHCCNLEKAEDLTQETFLYEEEIRDECDKIRQIEDKSEVNYLLSAVSPEQREAVILRFGEQLEFREIAKIMGCNMRTAQSRVRNALKIMRKEQENER